MFEAAIEAGTAAARLWRLEDADPASGTRCCDLCFQRFRVLVLDGPLGGLPHGVAHAVVGVVDALIDARVREALERYRSDAPAARLGYDDLGPQLQRRLASIRGSLVVVALEELGAAGALLAEVRRHHVEPAVLGFLLEHRMDGVPEAWD